MTTAQPYLSAISFVGSSLRPTNETTSTPSMFLMPSRCLMPNAPAPASATLIAACSGASAKACRSAPTASASRPTGAIALQVTPVVAVSSLAPATGFDKLGPVKLPVTPAGPAADEFARTFRLLLYDAIASEAMGTLATGVFLTAFWCVMVRRQQIHTWFAVKRY